MAQPADISKLPKISALRGITLVNGELSQTPTMLTESGRGPRGSRGEDGLGNAEDLTSILFELRDLRQGLEIINQRLETASVDANCSDGTVTVVLNI